MFQARLVAALLLEDHNNEIVLRSGTQKQVFQVSSGFHAVEMSLCAGKQIVEVFRNGKRIIAELGQMEVTSTPRDRWNFNLFVQEASRF